jgi:soluble lytic murein transglycosylase-like protein
MDLSTTESRVALATKYATKYNLPAALVCAVCDHESSWYPWASKFEPAFEAHYLDVPKFSALNATEHCSRAMSFGLMQVMGETAREMGFTGRSCLELCDPDTGVEFGCRKLAACLRLAAGDQNKALSYYNGGGDPTYPATVLALVPKYESA